MARVVGADICSSKQVVTARRALTALLISSRHRIARRKPRGPETHEEASLNRHQTLSAWRLAQLIKTRPLPLRRERQATTWRHGRQDRPIQNRPRAQ